MPYSPYQGQRHFGRIRLRPILAWFHVPHGQGLKGRLVEGAYTNLKVTTREDMLIAEALVGEGLWTA